MSRPQEQLEFYDTESSNESGSENLSWIAWFCSLAGHDYFAEVSEEFIEDEFNLTGLNSMVPFYTEALNMVLDIEPEEEIFTVPDVSIVESSAELLYGLIHQRYILTRQGLQQMLDKYESGHFGYCQRVYCNITPLIACGRSDLPGLETVKLFCPSCLDLYVPASSKFHNIDGAFFGTTFAHLLFDTYPEAHPYRIASQSLKEAMRRVYTPRIFGFRVSEKSKVGPRMRWLRKRPRDDKELYNLSDGGDESDGDRDIDSEERHDEEEEEEEEDEEDRLDRETRLLFECEPENNIGEKETKMDSTQLHYETVRDGVQVESLQQTKHESISHHELRSHLQKLDLSRSLNQLSLVEDTCKGNSILRTYSAISTPTKPYVHTISQISNSPSMAKSPSTSSRTAVYCT